MGTDRETLRQGVRVLAIAGLMAAAACGGAHYDGQQFVGENVRFRLREPSSPWERAHVSDEADLAWVDGDRVLHASGSCDPRLDIPLQALTNHLLIGFTERDIESETLREFNGREALVTRVSAKLDGVPREMELVVLKKNECVYDFSLVAPPGSRFDSALPAFEAMLQSFEAP